MEPLRLLDRRTAGWGHLVRGGVVGVVLGAVLGVGIVGVVGAVVGVAVGVIVGVPTLHIALMALLIMI